MNRPTRILFLTALFVGASLPATVRAATLNDPPAETQTATVQDEARATCDSLRKEQPSSSWNRECVLLRAGSVTDVRTLAALAKVDAVQSMDWSKMNADLANMYVGDSHLYYSVDGKFFGENHATTCLLYTSPSPRDRQ